VKHLYFCRHGESVLNVQQIYAGQTDTPLTDRGQEQAHQAGKQAHDMHIDLIVTSTLVRALETAQIIAGELGYPTEKIIASPLFMERSFGSLEGKPYSTPFDEAAYPDMESEVELQQRVEAAFTYLQTLQAENILVVGHGTFSICLRTLIDPAASTQELPNATIVQFM
jgi:broad specificity phosphatase PhoE